MIPKEKRIKIWYLIKKVTAKKGIVNIPDETKEDYWERMKLPAESIRYLVIGLYNLDVGFFFREFEESDLKGENEQARLREMYEGYFHSQSKEDNKESNWEELLLIDVKTMRPWLLSKELKYTKKII